MKNNNTKFNLILIALLGFVPNTAKAFDNLVSTDSLVSRSGNVTTITTNSSNSFSNWQSLNLPNNRVVNINQPTSNSVHVMRQTISGNTFIDGTINSNGTIALVNNGGNINFRGVSINAPNTSITAQNINIIGGTNNINGNLFLNQTLTIGGNSSNAHLIINGNLDLNGNNLNMTNNTFTNSRVIVNGSADIKDSNINISSQRVSPNFGRFWSNSYITNDNTSFNLKDAGQSITLDQAFSKVLGSSLKGNLIIDNPEVPVTPVIPTVPALDIQTIPVPEQQIKQSIEIPNIETASSLKIINICSSLGSNSISFNNVCLIQDSYNGQAQQIVIENNLLDDTSRDAKVLVKEGNNIYLY